MQMREEPLALLPEICLLAGAVACLLLGSFLPRRRQWIARLVAAGALLGTATTAAVALAGEPRVVFESTYAVDVPTAAARLIIAAATLLALALGTDEIAGTARESETYALLLLTALGATVLAGTSDLLILATGYLLASIPLYALVGIARSSMAAEAAMKTYLLGALLGITLLLGATVLYGLSGETTYAALAANLQSAPPAAVAVGAVAVLAGLLFKAGGVPGHFWVPDAAQGATVSAAAFVTTVPKVGALVAAYRLLDAVPATVDWSLLVGVLAAASMTLGNLAAFAQSDPRRLLGWSTVSQVGYLLLPVAVAGRSDLAVPSMLVYLAGYAVTNLTAFAVVAALPERRDLASYRGLAASRPWLAGALLVSLLSLVGTPPTAVFVGKLTTFTAAWDGGSAWLVIVAALNSVASLFYYLRWIAPAYRSQAGSTTEDALPPTTRPWATRAAVIGAVAVICLGLASGVAWDAFTGPLIR